MVGIDASSVATCDSRAIVTLSRNRRWTRVLIVCRNHVAVAEMPRATRANRTEDQSARSTPSPSSLNQRASIASGSAATSAKVNAVTISVGSYRYPSLHSRQIEESAGGNGSMPVRASGEDVIPLPFLVFNAESLCLKIEHRAVASV